MPIASLTEEQITSWTRAQKDQWWLENVYRGDMAQLTVRSAIVGFLLGGVLSATGLYIGAKTGISIGAGLTSVILAFALFRMLTAAGVAKDLTVLENNCTQSIATASAYVVTPLFSSLAAFMLVTGTIPPWWELMLWILVVSAIGVLIAFPLKRRFINEDQAPFPEGRACGIVLDSLYEGKGEEGVFKSKLLAGVSASTAVFQALVSDGWMTLIQFKLLRLNEWAEVKIPWHLRERFDDYYYMWAAKASIHAPTILGTDIRQLGLRLTLDAAMLGVGGLMGIAIAASCLLGAVINFVVLAPIMIQAGDIVPRLDAAGAPIPLSRVEIVNQWSIWWGVTMMVVGSLTSLAFKPELFTGIFKRRARATAESSDVLKDIEVPLWISWIGIPVLGLIGCYITHKFFHVPFWLTLVSLPLIFVLTLICANSIALTSWAPTGSMSKISQFTVGMLDRSNPGSNLLPAGMTAEIAANASSLLSDIKPGYMLGGKPRHQVLGHLLGNVAGVVACVPLFFLLFLPRDPSGVRTTHHLVSDQFAMPAAMQWKGIADIIAGGFKGLPTSALIAVAFAALAAFAIELANKATDGRFPLSSVAIGLGVTLPPEATLAMFAGALIFWIQRRNHAEPGTKGHRIWVEGMEPVCAGLITGAALMGIGNAVIKVLL